MKSNVGSFDKIIRIALAAIVAILYFTGVIAGTLGIVLLVLAAVLLLTSLFSFCPMWAIFHVSTCKNKA